MIRIYWNPAGIPGLPGLSNRLRGFFPVLIAPGTCRALDRPELPQLSEPDPNRLFNEFAPLPDGDELTHFL